MGASSLFILFGFPVGLTASLTSIGGCGRVEIWVDNRQPVLDAESVCVCVQLSPTVRAPTFKSFDLNTLLLVFRYIFIKSRTGSCIKVIRSRSRSQEQTGQYERDYIHKLTGGPPVTERQSCQHIQGGPKTGLFFRSESGHNKHSDIPIVTNIDRNDYGTRWTC